VLYVRDETVSTFDLFHLFNQLGVYPFASTIYTYWYFGNNLLFSYADNFLNSS